MGTIIEAQPPSAAPSAMLARFLIFLIPRPVTIQAHLAVEGKGDQLLTRSRRAALGGWQHPKQTASALGTSEAVGGIVSWRSTETDQRYNALRLPPSYPFGCARQRMALRRLRRAY